MSERGSKRILSIPDEFWIVFIIMVGVFLKIVYDTTLGFAAGTMNAGVWQEFGRETQGSGHISVIQYYYTHHMLPDFDPRGYTGFSNPPFFYIISSLILDLFSRLLKFNIGVSLKILECFNVFYVLIGQCAGVAFLQKYGVKGKKMILGVLLLVFSPVYYHMSTSMDGAAMTYMFMMLALNLILSWYGSRRYRTFVSLSIFLGLAMMTSLSAVMILPSVIYLMIKGMIDGRRNDTPIKLQILTGIIIVSVLGLWWPIYLKIRFGLPLFYVEAPFGMTINASVIERVIIPPPEVLHHLHTIGNHAYETNIWGQLLKTAVVDFQAMDLKGSGTLTAALVLLYLILVTTIIEHVMHISSLSSGRIDREKSLFLLIGECAIVFGFIFCAFRYPYVGTMNYKSIAPVAIFPMTGFCLFGSEEPNTVLVKILSKTGGVLVFVTAILTALLYGYFY